MISHRHNIELYINKSLVELVPEGLKLRLNERLYIPTKTFSKQAEYSYTFNIPSTPTNDRILDYANSLPKLNKFNQYECKVYADGKLLFDGQIVIQGYDGTSKNYECNLVNIRIETMDDIFGDAVMTDAQWDVDFSGATTINTINSNMSEKYYFPLVSYGVFQKDYITKDEVGAEYTSKFVMDKYNKWWVETFYPSLNVLETIRKVYEWKGYTVDGSAFYDPYLSNIYASCNLASEQQPTYNLGNPLFGELHLTATWNNNSSTSGSSSGFGSNASSSFANSTGGLQQDLNFPYYRIKSWGFGNADMTDSRNYYNFSTIQFWNMLDSTNNQSGVTVHCQDTYMYEPKENVIVIPADGFYEINLSVQASLLNAGHTFQALQYTSYNAFWEPLSKRYLGDESKDIVEKNVTITKNLLENTPLEIQLIRNWDENIELIKGRKNVIYATGDPTRSTYNNFGQQFPNKEEWDTDYPHQDLYASVAPTVTDRITTKRYVTINQYGNFGGNKANKDGLTKTNTYGYMHRQGSVMPYDPAVSEAFICGFSSMGGGTVSVMRDGQSWSKETAINNEIFAQVNGMELIEKSGAGTKVTQTNYCANSYQNSSCSLTATTSSLNGSLKCCVYLKKNDILELVAVQRDYEGQKYACSANISLDIRAISPKHKVALNASTDFRYGIESEFPQKLNLFNFTNKETRISDWITSIKNAFNLDFIQNGKMISINANKNLRKNITYAVDLDDRANSYLTKTELIEYPREMSVKYKINKEEWGFEKTVPQEYINDDDWYKYGDSGYTVISLSNAPWNTSTQNVSTNFSYTYYDNFTWKEVVQNHYETGIQKEIRIPVIEKSEYMADGYGYEEAMKKDGYSMTQRFWYRQPRSTEFCHLNTIMNEKVWFSYPMNAWNGFNLSYKNTERSLLEYFDIHPLLSSNYAYVECYITSDEFTDLKNGALVHFDSDVYYVSEISGYDPSGDNMVTLKLIKKTD